MPNNHILEKKPPSFHITFHLYTKSPQKYVLIVKPFKKNSAHKYQKWKGAQKEGDEHKRGKLVLQINKVMQFSCFDYVYSQLFC